MKQALRSASRHMRLGVGRTGFCSRGSRVPRGCGHPCPHSCEQDGLCSALVATSRTETPGPARPSHMARDAAPSCPMLQQVSGDSGPPGTSSPPHGTYCSQDTVTGPLCAFMQGMGAGPSGQTLRGRTSCLTGGTGCC